MAKKVNATDEAIALAQELGVNIEAVKGTGQDGRVLVADVEALGVQPAAADIAALMARIEALEGGKAAEDKQPAVPISVRSRSEGAEITRYRFTRHIDKFGPKDPVPAGLYSEAELASMLHNGIIE